jgi:signal transduction histidine kinase
VFNRIRPVNADGSSPSYLNIAQPTLCALRDRDGRLFFSVNLFGVVECELRGTSCTIVRTFTAAEGLGFRSTRAMTQTRDGSLWFGGFFEGISRLQGDSIRNYTQEDGLTDNGIRVLHESRDGTLWIGTRHGGMCVYRNGKFFEYPTYAALRSNTVWSLAEDSSGVMWVGTEQGLASFRPDPEYNVQPDVHHYDEREGISAERIVSLAVDNSFLYCGLNSGFYVIDRSALLNEPAPSFLYLKSIAVNGIDVSSRTSLDFSPDENTLTIGYGVANQTASGSSLYRYKLAGLMTDWSPPTQQTEITFAKLRPGSYAITIESLPARMRHEAGPDSTRNPNVSVQFTVGAPYWQTPWFASCVIAALIGAGYGYSRYRVRARAKDERIRAEENERVRKKVAADFHDEFGHRLTRISLFSEILKTKSAVPELMEYIEKIRSNAQSTYSGVRDFLWTLDPQYDSLYDLAIRLKSFGVELFDKTSISFRCAPIEPALRDVRLSLDWRRHLTLIFQEAMTNALKHSGCASVSLDVRADNGSIAVSFYDDGIGIPANPEGTGNGLRNMNNRAEELRGSLSVMRQNSPGGTQVMFSGRIP